MIRILICDDHMIVREGLKQVLTEIPGFVVSAEAGSGADALRILRTAAVDVMLLDINMPDRDGLDTLKQVRKEKHRAAVLMLSIYPDSQYAIRALRMGASGYLNKSSGAEELETAIRKVHGGGHYVGPQLAEALAMEIVAPSGKHPHEQLSRREFQVFSLLANGMRVGEIADSLSLSVNTVSTYRARVLGKFHLQNEVELVRYAIKHEIVAL